MLLRLQDELRERIGSRCVIFISKPYFLEIMPYNCGKGVSKEPMKGHWRQQKNSSHMEILQKKVALCTNLPLEVVQELMKSQ